MRGEIILQNDIGLPRRKRNRDKTFNEAADSYIAAGGSPRYLDRLRIKYGHLPLWKIDRAKLLSDANELYPNCKRLTLIRQFYAPLIAVWNHAARLGWVEPRAWPKPRARRGTSIGREPQRNGSFPVAHDRAARFVTEMSPAPAFVITTLFFTGMRPIEAFALECEDVDLGSRWLVVRSSKTGQARGVPMHEFLVPLFESLVKRGGRVFRTPKGKNYQLSDNNIGRGGGQLKTAILGAARRSGIKDVSPYTGRHTVSTQLVVAGVHPYVKDQILGHATNDMSRRYTNIPQAPLIEAINKLLVPDLWRTLDWWSDPLSYARLNVRQIRARR